MKNTIGIAVVLIILLLFLSVVVACDDDEQTPEATVTPSSSPTITAEPSPELTPEPTSDVTGDPNEPSQNPFLADSPWAAPHRNSYCQGSSFHPGPAESPSIQTEDFLLGRPALIHPEFSSPYPDGGRVIWASAYGEVVKIDPEGEMRHVAYRPAHRRVGLETEPLDAERMLAKVRNPHPRGLDEDLALFLLLRNHTNVIEFQHDQLLRRLL